MALLNTTTDGGALELYPLDVASGVETVGGAAQGVPTAVPTALIIPAFNSMGEQAVSQSISQ